jgi:hypothetical protein
MARNRVIAAAATTLILPLLSVTVPASVASAKPAATPAPAPVGSDVRELTKKEFTLDGKKLDVPSTYQGRKAAKKSATKAAPATPQVGTVRQWLALNDVTSTYYRKDYTLRAVGEKIEVWVANDTSFPAGDCRNDLPSSTQITDAQVADLVTEFDTNIYPKEIASFSTPPDRDGTNAKLGPDPATGQVGDYTGDGDKTVTLVDNVRDDNFFDLAKYPTYTAGFFWATFNEAFDRNVMTIDAFDWLHRTGANPPNEPTDNPCTNRGARPRAYEGTFAHEWQHLLQYYTDPAEASWINEGLSMFAETLVGYANTTATIDEPNNDLYLNCLMGFGNVRTDYNTNPRECGGAQNSLNLWGEGEPSEVLADYGIASQFMLFLYDRYGQDFISALHRDGGHQSLDAIDSAVEAEGVKDVYQVIHDFQTMTLVDRTVGRKFGLMLGASKKNVTSKSLRSTVNLANPESYNDPGAAPNGADYVQLQKAGGTVLRGADLKSLTFRGAKNVTPTPVAWTVVDNDPDRAGNPVLFSGNDSNINEAIVVPVSVPAGSPSLTLLAKYGAEADYDYGYVKVSTDGGATYTAIAGDRTVAGPDGPSLNGTTDGFQPHSFDLSAYAGTDVLLSIQYVSDGGVNEGGLLVDDIAIGSTVISDGSSLAGFRSPTQVRPAPIAWNLRLIGIDDKLHTAWQFEYKNKSTVDLGWWDLAVLSVFPKVVAVVAYDEPTAEITQYAPYSLTVNGVVQPGGVSTPLT